MVIKKLQKRIFISSTYIDLINYRRGIWGLLSSFYVDVSGMEKFGSQTKLPIQTCLDEVRRSNVFVGVVGMRYGSVEDTIQKSFSELEYLTAVENNLEILIYLIDEAKAKVIPEHIDFKNIEKLKKFKGLLSKKHTIQKFADEE